MALAGSGDGWEDVMAELSGYEPEGQYTGGELLHPEKKDHIVCYRDTPARDQWGARMRDAYMHKATYLRNSYAPRLAKNGKWVWGKKYTKYKATITQVFVALMGVFARIGMGKVVDGEFHPVPIYMPRRYASNKPVDASGEFFCHQSPDNEAVYVSMRQHNIHSILQQYIRSLEDCGFFNELSPLYIADATVYASLLDGLRNAICSTPHTANGGFSADEGIQPVGWYDDMTWAIGSLYVTFPGALTNAEWMGTNRDKVPQVRLEIGLLEEGQVPFIPTERHYPLSDNVAQRAVMEQTVTKLVDAMNLAILRMFEKDIHQKTLSENRLWLCRIIVNLMHQFTPHFMYLLGTQYASSVCTRTPGDARPPAYYPCRTYLNRLTNDHFLTIGDAMYCIGSVMFAEQAPICPLIGAAGTGKTTIVDMMRTIAGGVTRVYYIANPFQEITQFNLFDVNVKSMMLMNDIRNTPVPINAVLAAFTGLKRSSLVHHTSEEKGKSYVPTEARPLGMLMTANFPYVDVAGVSLMGHVITCISKTGDDGMRRRYTIPCPFLLRSSLGTSTQFKQPAGDTTLEDGFVFDEFVIKNPTHKKTETHMIMLLLGFAAYLGGALADADYGISDRNPLYLSSFRTWLAYGKNAGDFIKWKLESIIKPSAVSSVGYPYNGVHYRVKMRQGITLTDIKERYRDRVGMILTDLPLCFGDPITAHYCERCHKCFISEGFALDATTGPMTLTKFITDTQSAMFDGVCPQGTSPCHTYLTKGEIYDLYEFI